MTDNNKLDYLTKLVESHHEETKLWRKGIEDRLSKTETELYMYKTIIAVIKWLGGLVLLILTLNFGDIAKYVFPNG